MTDDRRVSDEEAREIWRRAVRLQGAAERAEARDELPSSENAPGAHDPSALPVEQVVGAAKEAGISADHVLLALAERRLVDWEAIRPERWTTRWLRRLVGHADAVEVSRFVRASPVRVLDAVDGVTAAGEFELAAEGRYGEDPAQGIALVFRNAPPSTGSGPSGFHLALDVADARALIATIRAEGEGTRLRLRAPLYRRGLNLALAGGSAGLTGGGGAAGGVAAGEAAAGLLGAASLAGVWSGAALGLILGGGVGVWGYRKLYSWGVGKGDAAVRRLASAIAMAAESQDA
ncbi:MAG: hypothetical protein ACODAA_08935 [Gemmatimonadota bacterium]